MRQLKGKSWLFRPRIKYNSIKYEQMSRKKNEIRRETQSGIRGWKAFLSFLYFFPIPVNLIFFFFSLFLHSDTFLRPFIHVHQQLRCTRIHTAALVKRHTHSCTDVCARTRTGALAVSSVSSAGTKSCLLFRTSSVFSRSKSRLGVGGGGGITTQTLRKRFFILHRFLTGIFPQTTPRMHLV